jgi:hypothetical protein
MPRPPLGWQLLKLPGVLGLLKVLEVLKYNDLGLPFGW